MKSTFKKLQKKLANTVEKVKEKVSRTNKETISSTSTSTCSEEENISFSDEGDSTGSEEECKKEEMFRLENVLDHDTSRLPTRVREKVEGFKKILIGKNGVIDVSQMRELCFGGVPEDIPGLRSLVWKIVIGYLPKERRKWEPMIEEMKETYQILLDTYVNVQGPSDKVWADQDEDELQYYLSRSTELKARHPQFAGFFSDRDLWQEIEKDSTRTRAEMNFFSTQTGKKFINPFNRNKIKIQNNKIEATTSIEPKQKKTLIPTSKESENQSLEKNDTQTKTQIKQNDTNSEQSNQSNLSSTVLFANNNQYNKGEDERHLDVLTRMLFVYAKTNPGIRYVQGMNEILAVFYHAFVADKGFADSVESDCFFCFTIIMAEARDCFLKSMDDSDSGIRARIFQLNNLLKKVDINTWNSLEKFKVDPHFYSLRWLMLIFTQEFQLFDVMRLWDSYLSHQQRQEFLNYLCLAVIRIRRQKLQRDFSEILQTLQRIDDIDVLQIIVIADELYKKFSSSQSSSNGSKLY